MLLAPAVIRFLEQRGIGKGIREEGPERHLSKSGTLTMGGIIILVPVIVTTVLLNFQGRSILVPLLTLLAHGALGAVDDFQSLVRNGGSGISVRPKFILLFLFALA